MFYTICLNDPNHEKKTSSKTTGSALDGKTTQRPQTEMTSVSIAKVTLVIKKKSVREMTNDFEHIVSKEVFTEYRYIFPIGYIHLLLYQLHNIFNCKKD